MFSYFGQNASDVRAELCACIWITGELEEVSHKIRLPEPDPLAYKLEVDRENLTILTSS